MNEDRLQAIEEQREATAGLEYEDWRDRVTAELEDEDDEEDDE